MQQHEIDRLRSIAGRNIRFLRKYNKYTRKEMADKLGMSESSITYYEGGKNLPSIFVLKKIAYLFGVTLDTLLDEMSAEQLEMQAIHIPTTLRSLLNLRDPEIRLIISLREHRYIEAKHMFKEYIESLQNLMQD